MLTLILILLPFIQLGTSYYASIAAAMLVLTVIAWRGRLLRGAVVAFPFLAVAGLMLFAPLAGSELTTSGDLLRVGREAAMFVILVSALAGLRRDTVLPPPNVRLLLWLTGALLALVVVQTVFYTRNVYFGLPSTLYAFGENTFATELSLRFSEGNLRPSATFAEPSYLGFVLLSLALAIFPLVAFDRRARWMLAMIVVAGLMARSLSFILAMGIVFVVPVLLAPGGNRATIRRSTLVVPLLLAAAMLAFTRAGQLLTRVGNSGSLATTDASTAMRLFGPIAATPGYIAHYPLGQPFSRVQHAVLPFLPEALNRLDVSLDNAFFNILFVYGVIGVVVLVVIFGMARDWQIRLYLLACMMFNGGFLSLDKVTVVILAVAFNAGSARAARAVARRRLAGPPLAVDTPPALVAER